MIIIAVAMGFTTLGGQARAGLIVDVSQVGDNVAMYGSGSINSLVLTRIGDGGTQPVVTPSTGEIVLGSSMPVNVYAGLSGPASFGTGGYVIASSGSGDSFGFWATNIAFGVPVIFLPFGYASGTTLTASATYDSTTIAALGLTPGTYTYAPSGLGATVDNSFTINIRSVPEPTSLTMAATALGLFGALAFHRYSRNKS
jgi:hypothetical protein